MSYNKYWIIGSSIAFITAGLYSGERIFFMGFAILASMMLYSILTSLWVLYDFNYLQKITSPTATKGGQSILSIEIHNDKPFIFPYIKLYYQTPECVLSNSYKEWVSYVLPFKNHKINEAFTCNLRGHYSIGLVKVEVKDLFGLFTFSINLLDKHYHRQLSLTVYPRVLILPHLPLPQMHMETVLNRNFSAVEEPASIANLRQYRFGDPLKKIHWKISAKFQDIYVKNYETNTQPQVYLLAETSSYAGVGISRYQVEDQIVECTTAIVYYILSKNLPLKLIMYRNERQQLNGRSPQDFERFFNFLALMPFSSPFSMADMLEMESSGLSQAGGLVLVLHRMSLPVFNHLCLLKQSSIFPVLFLVQHSDHIDPDAPKMLKELNEKGIPSFMILADQRIDEILEAVL